MLGKDLFTLKWTDVERGGELRLKRVLFLLFLSMVVFVAFLAAQLWMDRRAIQRQERSFNRHQARQAMIARQALEDHLRSVINRMSIMAGTTVSEALNVDSFKFIQDGLTILIRANDDILSALFRLEDRRDRVYSYHRALSPGAQALAIGRAALDLDHFVNLSPMRVDQINLIEGHPLISVVMGVYSVKGEKRGQMAAVIDLLPSVERYVVPLQGGLKGWAYLLDDDGNVIYHPLRSVMGKNVKELLSPDGEGIESWEEILGRSSGSGVHRERINPNSVAVRKLAVWDTIRVLDHTFRLVLSTPDTDIDVVVKEDRAIRFLLGIFLVGTIGVSILWRIESSHQKALKTSEARYQAIIDDQYELVTRFTPEGFFTFANDAYCRFFSVNRRELIGANIREFRPAEDVAVIMDLFGKISPKEPSNQNEEMVLLGDGSIRYLSWSNRGIFGDRGVPTEIQAVARDITDRKKMEMALQEEALELEKLNLIAQRLTATGTKSELIKALLVSLTGDMGFPLASITTVAPNGTRRIYGSDRGGFANSPTDEEAISTGKTATATLQDGLHQTSIPVVFQGNVMGAINLATCQPMDARDARMVCILADHTAGLLELLRLMEKRTQEALVDPLTEIWNRRFIIKHLETENSRIRRYGERASLILIDLGDFKLVNDLHGHEAGDETLRKVAQTLSETIRSCDMVARYGGDEFLVYMPNTSPNQARTVMTRAAQILEAKDFPISISMDYGVAGLPEDGNDLLEVIKVADRRMYAAKAIRKQNNPT